MLGALANGTTFIGLKSTADQIEPFSPVRPVRPGKLSNKDEEGDDCDGREYNHEQGCIEQIPNREIFIFCCCWVSYLPLGLPGLSVVSQLLWPR